MQFVSSHSFVKSASAVLVTILVAGLPSLSAARGGSRDSGGAFQYNNSRPLLKDVSENLAREIETMNPKIFAQLPKGLGQKEMAKIIRGVRMQAQVFKTRPNTDGDVEPLMFDFGRDKNGPYIVAYKGYFDAYQGVPYVIMKEQRAKKQRPSAIYYDHIQDVRRRLVHEYSHLLGKNEQQAKDFSLLFEHAANTDMIYCKAEKIDFPQNFPNEQKGELEIFIDRRTNLSVSFLSDPTTMPQPLYYLQASVKDIKENGVNANGCFGDWLNSSTMCGERRSIYEQHFFSGYGNGSSPVNVVMNLIEIEYNNINGNDYLENLRASGEANWGHWYNPWFLHVNVNEQSEGLIRGSIDLKFPRGSTEALPIFATVRCEDSYTTLK